MSARRWSWRAPLTGMLLATLVAVPILVISGARRHSAHRTGVERDRVGLEHAAQGELDGVFRRLERAAARLAGEPHPEDLSSAKFYDWAARRAVVHDLDLLELHQDGFLVSSAHWPEQAGLPREPPAIGPFVDSIAAAAGNHAAILLGTEPFGDRRMALKLGSFVDAALVDGIVGARPAMLRLSQGIGVGVSSSAGAPVVSDEQALQRVSLTEPAPLSLEYLVAAAPPRWGGSESLLLMVAMFTGALFGAVTIGRVRSPVARLIEAVEAVSAGRADYDFSGTRDEAWEELAAAFSRLQRSLDMQQRRRAAAERVAAWRDVARRVAHEVKNPLAPIRLTVENLQRARDRDPALFDRLFEEGSRTILEEVDNLRRLVSEFAEFARMPEMRRESVEFRGWLADQIALYASDPQLHLEFAPGAAVPVMIDPEQFGRVMKNLLSNAVEAMRESPTRALRIELHQERGMVELTVADRGPGFDAETLGRAFEPYFTTREQGTGLGLSIVERIVIEHGGWIDIGNRADGDGAWVRVGIPLAENLE